jgi:hypothetical protein
MRYAALLLGASLIFACSANGQVSPANTLLLRSPVPTLAFATPTAVATPGGAPPASAAPEPPQGVYGVFQDYNFRAYLGYTFLRFCELPNFTSDMNGLNLSVAWYPRGGHIGPDGEFVEVFGSQSRVSSTLALGMGGARLRWSASRDVEFWAHGLAGGAHSTPQTPYGSQNAFGFELGGGIDLTRRHRRLAYRLQADAVGTRFFGTYQYSPKISAGIVYKF